MKNNTVFKLFTFIFICSCLVPQLAYAKKWEDYNTPISFQIEMLCWNEVNKIIPNKTKFSVIDIETGSSFQVQRRAGSNHADVQPLTGKDTKIMKKIYNGKWSWKRRAIIVLTNDEMIAASMHGMPHGAGALQNNFPGHFCIHFYGSTTHRLKKEDFSHKLMILKAAGKLDEYVNTVSPNELIKIFESAVNQNDKKILKMTLSSSKGFKKMNEVIKNITNIKIKTPSVTSSEDVSNIVQVEIPVKITMYVKEDGREKRSGTFTIKRDSITHRWMIDQDSIYNCLH
ncbi:hypothetical protein [Bacillus manliponensis]|uniref:hypothetical protein n=1 Tax=Bacillus manliponensis TaxID=574376 RepID=UPI0035177B6B